MSQVVEVAPDIFKLTTFVPEAQLQFSQFLVRDEEPLLYHTGLRKMFPLVKELVAKVLPPSSIRWISFSHFEADECGSLNEWLAVAPRAQATCGFLGAVVSVDDFADRPARPLEDGEVLVTGAKRFRWVKTPHVPHNWEAGHLFEETGRTLLCSDLFHQNGDVEARTTSDVVGRARQTLVEYQGGPFGDYIPYRARTADALEKLAKLEPRHLATMHGSTFEGDGARAIRDLARVYAEVLGG